MTGDSSEVIICVIILAVCFLFIFAGLLYGRLRR